MRRKWHYKQFFALILAVFLVLTAGFCVPARIGGVAGATDIQDIDPASQAVSPVSSPAETPEVEEVPGLKPTDTTFVLKIHYVDRSDKNKKLADDYCQSFDVGEKGKKYSIESPVIPDIAHGVGAKPVFSRGCEPRNRFTATKLQQSVKA